MNTVTARLKETFAARRFALKHRIAWVLSDGEAFVMDPATEGLLTAGFSSDCALTILTNASTVDALLDGGLDPSEPKPGQLFVWGGDPDALRSLADCLRGLSVLGLQAVKGAIP
jgi:hypothetical protein